jgi:hypothetical protein
MQNVFFNFFSLWLLAGAEIFSSVTYDLIKNQNFQYDQQNLSLNTLEEIFCVLHHMRYFFTSLYIDFAVTNTST